MEMGARTTVGMRMHAMVMHRCIAMPVLMGMSGHIAR
jgi:hypothetical protein